MCVIRESKRPSFLNCNTDLVSIKTFNSHPRYRALSLARFFYASVWFTSRKQSADLSLSVFYQSVSAVAALSYQSAGKPGRDGK